MCTESSAPELLSIIRTGYGIPLSSTSLLSSGWGGRCFRGNTGSEGYFIKVQDLVRPSALAPSSPEFYLPLMRQLKEKDLVCNIPSVVSTATGDLSLTVGERRIIVTRFIDGRTIGSDAFSDEELSTLARQIGRLHSSLDRVFIDPPFCDSYTHPFEEELIGYVSGTNASAGSLGEFADRLVPVHEQLKAFRRRLVGLRSGMQSRPRNKVICHTDIHGWNLLVDSKKKLYILDWENAIIAPPECDLIFFVGDERFWSVFWPPYSAEAGIHSIDCDYLKHYLYRRGLEDITDYLVRVSSGEGTAERDSQDVDAVLETIEDLTAVEDTADSISREMK